MENIIPKDEIPEGIENSESTNKEILELILKYIYENNYLESAKLLEQKTNIKYHQSETHQLITMISSHKFEEAINYLTSLPELEKTQKDEVIKLIRYRQYFEMLRKNLIEPNQKVDAFSYLRDELSKLIPIENLNKFSSLLFIKDIEILEETLKQNFEEIITDEIFAHKIQSLINQYINLEGNQILQNVQLENLLKTYVEYEKGHIDRDSPRAKFKQIGMIEKFTSNQSNDRDDIDEIWHLKFTKSYKYFAICLRNGSISIFTNHFASIINNNSIIKDEDIKTKYKLKITCISSFKAHKKYITSISWSPNEKLLLSSSNDKLIKMWDPFRGKCLKTFKIHSDIVSCSMFFFSNEKIISAGIDKKLILTQISTSKPSEIEQFLRIRQILISEALKIIIIIPASLNDVIIYDYVSNTKTDSIEELDPIISANISRHDKGKFLLTNVSKVNANINLYSLQTKELLNKYYGHRQEEYIIQCSFAGREDEYIICGSEENTILIWHRVSSIAIHEIRGHTGVVNECNLVFFDNFDMGIVYSVSDDYTLRIWGREDCDIEVEYENKAKGKEENNITNSLLINNALDLKKEGSVSGESNDNVHSNEEEHSFEEENLESNLDNEL